MRDFKSWQDAISAILLACDDEVIKDWVIEAARLFKKERDRLTELASRSPLA